MPRAPAKEGKEISRLRACARRYFKAKMSVRAIAALLGVARSTVHSWKKAQEAGVRLRLSAGRPQGSFTGRDLHCSREEAPRLAAEANGLLAELRVSHRLFELRRDPETSAAARSAIAALARLRGMSPARLRRLLDLLATVGDPTAPGLLLRSRDSEPEAQVAALKRRAVNALLDD